MSFRLSICTLVIGILTNSINGVPQYSREYLSPVIDTPGASNCSEVHNVDAVPERRTPQQQQVTFRQDDDSNENMSKPISMSPMNRTRSRALHPRSGVSKSGVFAVQRDHTGALKIIYPTRHPNNNYDVLTPGNRVRLPNDEDEATTQRRESDIVFPNDTDTEFQEPTNSVLVPKCKTDEIICTNVESYPENLIESIVKDEAYRFRDFFGEDKLIQPNITSRLGDPSRPGDAYLCDSEVELFYPQVGLTSQDKWKVIVNTPNYTQGIRIERCSRLKSPCNYANHFSIPFEPICEQKYIIRQLVSVNDRRKTSIDQFKIPSCCNCVLKQRNKIKSDVAPDED